jgi:hypothetical protein
MRIRPFGLLLIYVGVFTSHSGRAEVSDNVAPRGYTWCVLEHVTGKVLMPIGWICREIPVLNGAGYQIVEEQIMVKNGAAYDYHTGFTVKVYSERIKKGINLTTVAKGIYEKRKSEGSVSPISVGSEGPYTTQSFTGERMIAVGDSVEMHHFIETILFDTENPTMVYAVFDCPSNVWPQKTGRCKMFFSSLTLSRGMRMPNQSKDPAP